MTGMRNFNFNFSLCYLALTAITGAAVISFSGDHKITGEVVSIDEKGTVTLNAPYSDRTLQLNGDKISKIDFGKFEHKYEIPEQNLTLINGDSFPVEVRNLDDKVLDISSPALGDISIPRELVASLEIGIFSKKIIYTGPDKISDWKNSQDEIASWQVEDGKLVASGNSIIFRDMKLPESYSIRFNLEWDDDPNFFFSFGDPMDFSGKSVNRYYFQLRTSGIKVTRESTGKDRETMIAQIAQSPADFPNKKLLVEIRANSKNGNLHLYLNGDLQGRYVDTYPDIPNGKGISFFGRTTAENQITISDIEICEWEDRGERHRSEDRGDGKEDAIIGRNGERFGGKLISITNGAEDKVYRFKSNFQEEPIDLPSSEVSSIFFATKPEIKSKKNEGLTLFFQESGSIQVTKYIYKDSKVNITHPLLGVLEFNRESASRLERRAALKTNQIIDK